MRSTWTGVAVGALMLGACRATVVETDPVQPVAPATADALPVGTRVVAQTNQTLGAGTSRVGDRFTATVVRPVIARTGQAAVPAGAVITGTVTGLVPSRRVGEQAAIRIDFGRLGFGGRVYPLSATVVDTDVRVRGEREKTAARAAIGAVAGAALGAIIGGDLRDALNGGVLGEGAGTIISLGLGDVEAELPAGSTMTLQTSTDIDLK